MIDDRSGPTGGNAKLRVRLAAAIDRAVALTIQRTALKLAIRKIASDRDYERRAKLEIQRRLDNCAATWERKGRVDKVIVEMTRKEVDSEWYQALTTIDPSLPIPSSMTGRLPNIDIVRTIDKVRRQREKEIILQQEWKRDMEE